MAKESRALSRISQYRASVTTTTTTTTTACWGGRVTTIEVASEEYEALTDFWSHSYWYAGFGTIVMCPTGNTEWWRRWEMTMVSFEKSNRDYVQSVFMYNSLATEPRFDTAKQTTSFALANWNWFLWNRWPHFKPAPSLFLFLILFAVSSLPSHSTDDDSFQLLFQRTTTRC